MHLCIGRDCIPTGGSADFAYLETVNNQMKKLTGLY